MSKHCRFFLISYTKTLKADEYFINFLLEKFFGREEFFTEYVLKIFPDHKSIKF